MADFEDWDQEFNRTVAELESDWNKGTPAELYPFDPDWIRKPKYRLYRHWLRFRIRTLRMKKRFWR